MQLLTEQDFLNLTPPLSQDQIDQIEKKILSPDCNKELRWYLIGKLFHLIKHLHAGGVRKLSYSMAHTYGVSYRTIEINEQYAKAIDELNIGWDLKIKLLDGKIQISRQNIHDLSKKSIEDQISIVQSIEDKISRGEIESCWNASKRIIEGPIVSKKNEDRITFTAKFMGDAKAMVLQKQQEMKKQGVMCSKTRASELLLCELYKLKNGRSAG